MKITLHFRFCWELCGHFGQIKVALHLNCQTNTNQNKSRIQYLKENQLVFDHIDFPLIRKDKDDK